MKIISGVYWDKGKRSVNQDSISLQQVMTSRGRVCLALISDGIGGLLEGENASGYITERLTENFYRQVITLIASRKGEKVVERSLLRCFYGVCEEIGKYAGERDIKLGATVSLLLIWKRKYLICHLGDSRIYLCKKEKQVLITKDHSDGRNGLTRCLGSFPYQRPDVYKGRIIRRSGFLLCTDGFYRMMESKELQMLLPREISSEEQIEKRLREIGVAGLKKGEKDNMSAVCIMVG